MEDHRFDLMVRAQAAAGSRRQGLKLLASGLLGGLLAHHSYVDVGAACRTFNKRCNTNHRCCKGVGLRCVDGRCKCRNGHDRCTAGPGCQNLKRDPDHCGTCDKQCPGSKPCCVKGVCRRGCGASNSCCPDCFDTISNPGEKPKRAQAICCQATGNIFCSREPGNGDDRCCFPNEECLKGRCCQDGAYGETNCAGTCCRQAACCNGTKCCKKGDVCALKNDGDLNESCVSAHRGCTSSNQCFSSETCHGGRCCSGVRLCQDAEGDDLCCNAGEYCESPNTSDARCTPVHTAVAGTYRPHRVRP